MLNCDRAPLNHTVSFPDDHLVLLIQPSSFFVECPSPSAPDVEVKTQEVNGEGDASNGCSQVQSSLGAKADSVTHGSSEELLFDFDDLPVEIGKNASGLPANLFT